MKMKLELVPLPVADVERAIAFYAGTLGFTKDVDVQPAEGVRIVQADRGGVGVLDRLRDGAGCLPG